MIISNPYAHSEATQAVVVRKHYMRRLKDPSFWIKVFKLGFNPLPYAQSAIRSILGRIPPSNPVSTQTDRGNDRPFTELMLAGFKQFRGQILLIMSGLSLTSEEFDVLITHSPAWQKAYQAALIKRADIAHADQTFSIVEARDTMISTALHWLTCQPEAKNK
jgi:hypothetical protein